MKPSRSDATRPDVESNKSTDTDLSTATSTPRNATPKQLRQAAIEDHSLDHRTRRKVVRGRVAIDGRIDLHGMRQREAEQALRQFIAGSARKGRRVVLVITGKGRRGKDDSDWWESEGRGVLRRLVPEWLKDSELARFVIGFEPAAQIHGGEGALYVSLRRIR